MRYLKIIIVFLLMLPLMVTAQSKKNLKQIYIGKLDYDASQNLYVKHGEFKIDFDHKITDVVNYVYAQNYRYMVIVRDSKDNIMYAKMNHYELKLNNISVDNLMRAGYSIPDFVYLEKRNVTYSGKPQYRYYLHVSGKVLGPYDEVKDFFQDGFIYRIGDTYSYCAYNDEEESNVSFVIPDESLYVENTIRCNLKNEKLDFKPTDNVHYYRSMAGHYYLLYYDNYMDNTLLVVDSTGYELDGVLETIDLKYSQNGEHWIAAYSNNLMVDGITVLQLSEKIKYVAIKNDGQYAYVVEGKGMNDRFYINNDIILQGIDMKWLATDVQERFNYICKSNKGYFYGIDDELFDKNEDMKNYYYPTLFDKDEKFVVKSTDGTHTMEYSYDTPYISIDNMRIDLPSIPHYAKWNEKERCFMWGAVEGINLFLYKYKVKR